MAMRRRYFPKSNEVFKSYKVTFRGIDGTDKAVFSRLGAVARYVKARDLGPEYRRSGGLQGEFGYFSFDGFEWKDILDGSPFSEDATYKANLLAEPMRLRYQHRTIKASIPDPTSFTDAWEAKDGTEVKGTIYLQQDGRYLPVVGHCCRDYLPHVATMEDAKAALIIGIKARNDD